MLAVTVSDGLCAAQAQREFRGPSRYIRRRKCRYRRIAVLQQALGIDFDPARRRWKSLRRSGIVAGGIGHEWDCTLVELDAAGRGAKISDREPGRRKDGVVTAIRLATEKDIRETQPLCSARTISVSERDDRPARRPAAAVEPAACREGSHQTRCAGLPAPMTWQRQDDIGVARGRIHEEISVNVKLQALEGTLRHGRIWMSTEQVGTERDEHPHRIRLAIEHRR